MTTEIYGRCDDHFRGVKEVFAESFAAGRELGAAVTVVLGGEVVVDLWAGIADRRAGKPWAADTLVNVYSTTKGFTSICAHRLADEGRLDLDAPIAKVWPEFAAAGKEGISLRSVLSHQAGLPAVRETLPPEMLFDWDGMCTALAAETPWWPPGTKHGYHAVTFGWLAGEVIRRVTGKTVGQYFREEITGPLGIDAHIGLKPSDDERCATLQSARLAPGQQTFAMKLIAAPESMAARAFSNPISIVMPATISSREWRGAEVPSANGHATARAVAMLYGALANGGTASGVRVMSPEEVRACAKEEVRGLDAILDIDTRFGAGFMLPQASDPFGTEGSFGHPGMGGSVGFADPAAKLGFGYVMNRLGTSLLVDPRAQALIDATYAALGR